MATKKRKRPAKRKRKGETKRPPEPEQDEPLSLQPLTFTEAVEVLLNAPPSARRQKHRPPGG